ncbi:MAG: carbamoyl phosphate synthase large subunit, partial [Proteobacteria bacterium]|nr:carbamoyl phosphate synthase large subunit [Pseudomonadota bacterium]
EHIEQAGVHSGDSACSLPPHSLSESIQDKLADQVGAMARALKVVGLMNTQFAIQGDEIFVLEVNPRASRTVPFVSKATGLPIAKIAVNCMVGNSLAAQDITHVPVPDYYCVKESVFPFIKFPGVDPLLGPEMKSTGEVMGVGSTFGEAFAKGQLAAGEDIPATGSAFISVKDIDKEKAISVAKQLANMNYKIYATHGTCKALTEAGIKCERVNKVREGQPHIVDMLKNDSIDLIVNTTEGKKAIADSYSIRRTALQHKVFYTTTMAGAFATIEALKQRDNVGVNSLQSLHTGVIA